MSSLKKKKKKVVPKKKSLKYKGTEYKSGWEVTIAKQMHKMGLEHRYEPMKMLYQVPSFKKRYTPDFSIGGMPFILETKGKFTAEMRAKHLLLKEQHPHIEVRFLFMRDNKIHKKSPNRYSDWCEKNGFAYAVGAFPREWLEELEVENEIY